MKKTTLLSLVSLSVVSAATLFAGMQYLNNTKVSGKYVPRDQVDHYHGGAAEIGGAMEYLHMLKANPETGFLDIKDVLEARSAVENFSFSNKNEAVDLQWEELGPDNVGGRTRAILVDKANSQRIIAGGVSGGLWISENGGSSWEKYDDQMDNLNISCITQAANGDIYVGTGEGNTPTGTRGEADGNSSFIGGGVWKSTDHGKTFVRLESTKPTANNSSVDWAHVNQIAADPKNSKRVYAATRGGLYVTSDGGETWTLGISGALGTRRMRDVDVGSDGSVIVALDYTYFTSDNGDPGTFVNRTTSLKDVPVLSGVSIGRLEFAVAPSDPNYVYVNISNSSGNGLFIAVLKSTDKGVTWEVIGKRSSQKPDGSYEFNPFGPQAIYNNTIEVFPNNKNKILVGGVELWSWGLTEGWRQVANEFSFPGNDNYIHPDKHTFAFDPANPNVFYVGSDGGVSKSMDGGKTFQTVNKGYAVTQFYTVAIAPNGYVMGGTQDNGTILNTFQGNTPKSGFGILGGDGAYCEFSSIYPGAAYASSQNGAVRRIKGFQSTWTGIFDSQLDGYGEGGPGTPPDGKPDMGATFIAPFRLWESYNDKLVPSYVKHKVRDWEVSKGVATVTSKTNAVKFYHGLDASVKVGDEIWIKDKVQSKFFMGVLGGVWMTREAWNFGKVPKWFKIASLPGVPHTMSYSRDGDHLFVGVSKSVYRISGISSVIDSLSLVPEFKWSVVRTANQVITDTLYANNDTVITPAETYTIYSGKDTITYTGPDTLIFGSDTTVLAGPDTNYVPADTMVYGMEEIIVGGDTVYSGMDTLVADSDTLTANLDTVLIKNGVILFDPMDSTLLTGDTLVGTLKDGYVITGQGSDTIFASSDTTVRVVTKVAPLNKYVVLDDEGSFTNPAFKLSVQPIGTFSLTVTDIAVDPRDPEHVVAVLGNYSGLDHVYQSFNAASTTSPQFHQNFESIQNDLPKMPIYSCVIDVNEPEFIIVGTEYGVYASKDAGKTWGDANSGMARVPVHMMRQQLMDETGNVSTTLVIGTHGRGIWRSTSIVSIDDKEEEKEFAADMHVFPNPMNGGTGFVAYNLSASSNVTLRIFDLGGKLISEKQFDAVPAGENRIAIESHNLEAGTYIVSLQAGEVNKSGRLIVVK